MPIEKFLQNDDESIDIRNISLPEPSPQRPYEDVLILCFNEDYKFKGSNRYCKLKDLESFSKSLKEFEVFLVPFDGDKQEWAGYCTQQSQIKEKRLRIACWSQESSYRLLSPASQFSKSVHYALDDFTKPEDIKLKWISNLEELKNLLVPEQGLLRGSDPLPVRREF